MAIEEHNRQNMIEALKKHAEGKIAKHKANVEVALKNSTMIGEHSDIIESVEKEIHSIGRYKEQLDVIKKYFEQQDPFKSQQ
tara:strand:+ start:564 stop:809 length:246 start_codon:yes stop_codon:yes gene_type:complete